MLRNKWLSLLTLVGLVVLSVWHPATHFLAINHVCNHAFFFYGGILGAILYKRNPDIIYLPSFAPIAFVASGAVYVVGRVWSIPLVTPLGGAILSLAIALMLEKLSPKTFSTFRNYTYQIYLLGIWFNVICTILRAKFGLPFAPMQVLSLLLGLYMPVLISKVIEKINWKPLKLCVGLK